MSEVVPLKRKPRFRVVASPEEEFAVLFAREATLLREIADVRAAIDGARARYAEKHDLLANPRTDLLRTRFGPQSAPPR